MTPVYTRKLQQALIDIGHEVEKDTTTPSMEQIKQLYFEFEQAVNHSDMSRQKKAVDKLLAGIVKWEVGKL